MTQRSIVAPLMPAATFRGANRYFLPSCVVSLPFGQLMAVPRLLILKDKKILRDTDESTHRRKGTDVGLRF